LDIKEAYMFEIKYELLDNELRRLSEVTNLEEFEYDLNEVVGQFQITINNEIEGFVDKDIPYEGEFIIEWLYLLNETVCCLGKTGFASFAAPDSNNIRYEFEINKQNLRMSKFSAKEKQIFNHIYLNPVEKEELFWNETISTKVFYRGVQSITDKFFRHLEAINPNLLNLKIVLRLKQSFLNGRDVVLTV